MKTKNLKKIGVFIVIYAVFLGLCRLDFRGFFSLKKPKEKGQMIFEIDSNRIKTYKRIYGMFRDTIKKAKQKYYENKNR